MPLNRLRLRAVAAYIGIAASVFTACSIDPDVVTIWGGELAVPKLLSLNPVASREIAVIFSAPVTVSGACVSLPEKSDYLVTSSWEESPDSGAVAFLLDESVGIGTQAILSATVTDERGNSLSFSIPFTGYNERPPELRINEVRTDYSKPKVEFIELVALSSGNLGGVEIYNAANTASPSWEFPAVEVKTGDIIMYHLRSVETGLVNELGALDSSAGADARPGARDFWDIQTKAPLKDTNVILVRARKDGPVLDALLLAAPGKTAWTTDALAKAADDAHKSGAWSGDPLISGAVSTEGMTVTRTVGRKPGGSDTDTAADWKVCAKGKSTPGAVNTGW